MHERDFGGVQLYIFVKACCSPYSSLEIQPCVYEFYDTNKKRRATPPTAPPIAALAAVPRPPRQLLPLLLLDEVVELEGEGTGEEVDDEGEEDVAVWDRF